VRFVVSGKYAPPSTGIFECDFVHLEAAPPRLSALSRAEFAEFNKQVAVCGHCIMRAIIRARAAASVRDGFGALGCAAVDVQHRVFRRASGGAGGWGAGGGGPVVHSCDLMLVQALSLLLVFGHEPQREAAAVMLFSRVVAPDMFPAVLGACFADASKLRLQQVWHTPPPTHKAFLVTRMPL
jgi:hypothetical protein